MHENYRRKKTEKTEKQKTKDVKGETDKKPMNAGSYIYLIEIIVIIDAFNTFEKINRFCEEVHCKVNFLLFFINELQYFCPVMDLTVVRFHLLFFPFSFLV